MDAFGEGIYDEGFTSAQYLDQSAFDEKFEIVIEDDYIANLYHIEDKYMVPVLSGCFREMFKYTRDHLIHPDDKEFASLMDPNTMLERFNDPKGNGMLKAEFREKLVDGSYRWVQYLGIMGTKHGVPEGKIYFYVYDIQNQKDRIDGKSSGKQYEKNRDSVTGLRKREYLVPAALEKTHSSNKTWCCIAIDIQHFKIFNTWFGYEKGNYLLSRIGNYLSELEKNQDAVATYIGRDNFALFIPYDKKCIENIYNEIRSYIFSYSNMLGFLPAFGVYILENGTKPGLEMYDKARLAVTDAKKTYLDRICYFDSSEYERTRKNFEFLTEFQKAIANNEIGFYVQPQCRFSDGKIVGAEALARWIKKDGTVVSPGLFVPFLETTGFITELDKFVWMRVVLWIRDLLDRNVQPIPVSINISQIDLLTIDVASYLYSLTETYNVPTKYIKVEITESAYAKNFEAISKTIGELKKKGFVVLLDDFGAGYSSLNMLDKINVDIIKLDMLFMKKDNSLGKKGVSIVESIFGMAKALEMPVIVEGVENDEQIRFLSNLGFKYAQGYYFYKPMSVGDFEELIRNDSCIDRNGIEMQTSDLFRAQEFLKENMFSESTLNRILGAVAFYSLEGNNLTITRFNEPFRSAIGDAQMDNRIENIQNYVVPLDHAALYQALRNAENNIAEGGKCEVRFFKSNGSVFWFKMHFYFLRSENGKKYYFGKVEDTTEQRDQSIHFFDVLRKQSDVTMCIRLEENKIQYITGENTLYQMNLPSMDLDQSIYKTAIYRIDNDADRHSFLEFFNKERLKDAYKRAIYHEVLDIDFKLFDKTEPIEFSTYYIRHHRDDSLIVYAFAKKRDREILTLDPLTGLKNRYAYNDTVGILNSHGKNNDKLVVFSIDINGLKDVNDAYGHPAGDELIKGTADIISKVISPYGSCFRIGGDEFVAIMYGDKKLAEYLKEELDKSMSDWSGYLVREASISSGYATIEEFPGSDVSNLAKMADIRMYRAKSMYYQKNGVDRMMKQSALNALRESYDKVLKANLLEDSYEIIRADEEEVKSNNEGATSLSKWILNFAKSEFIHPDDRAQFLENTSFDRVKKLFKNGLKRYMFPYRKKINGVYRKVIMEIITCPDYSETNQNVFVYVKDIDSMKD